MDVFVLTSYYEGMSNSIMEAMAAGLPVVTTDVGGNSELVINGETGFLCPPNGTKELAERVLHFIKNEREAKQMGENGKKKIANEFSIEKMVRATNDIYMKFLKRSNVLKI
jgi:glycosyltransferase involved in cell wall biosynthesis